MKRARVITIFGLLIALLLGGLFTVRLFPVDPVEQMRSDLRTRTTALDKLWRSTWNRLPNWIVTALPLPPPRNIDRIRWLACRDLAWFGPAASNAVPEWVDALSGPSSEIRQAAIAALSGIGPAARDAVPALIGVLTNKDNFLGDAAAEALGTIGPAASDAIPPLVEAMHDTARRRHVLIRPAAAAALSRIDPVTVARQEASH